MRRRDNSLAIGLGTGPRNAELAYGMEVDGVRFWQKCDCKRNFDRRLSKDHAIQLDLEERLERLEGRVGKIENGK